MSDELKTSVKKEVIDIEGRFNGKGNFDDIDFDKVELVRGKTPDDIEQKCLKLCQDYLSGNWSQQTVETIEVRRITGGLMNQIYYCGIRQPDNSGDVPQEVSIKFYGEHNPFNPEDKTRMKDLIVSLIFSENNLGPKVYGCFEGGVIQKYYKHRIFGSDKEKNPEVSRKVFRSLAKIHSLEFPVKRNGKHFMEMLRKLHGDNFHKIKPLIEEYNCETLKKYDFKTEIDWIEGVVDQLKSPILFCHNDFRSSNLLVTENDENIVVCDYDLSEYGYRGNDFVFMMREWGKKHFIDNMKSIEGLPLQSQMKPFIELYVEESERIHGKSFSENPINSVEHILKEAKILLMLSFLLFTAFHMGPRPHQQKDDNNNTKDEKEEAEESKHRMEGLETNYKNYNTIKNILKEQKLLD